MKFNRKKLCHLLLAILLTAGASWAESPFVGRRADALDSALWAKSQWISAHDAPIITQKIADNNERAADGASWFVTNIKNHKELSSIKWMTSGLGVYNLYINGKPVGEEILKPGFTH